MKAIYKYLLGLIACVALSVQAIGQNTLQVSDVYVRPWHSASLPILMNNAQEVVAMQFVLTVPNGVQVAEEVVLTERGANHNASIQQTDNNHYTVLVFSSTNAPFSGYQGQVMNIGLSLNGDLAVGDVYDIELSDVVLSARDGHNIVTDWQGGKLYVSDAPDLVIRDVQTDQSEYMPNGQITVSWVTENIGGQSLQSGWTVYIYLIDENGEEKLIGTYRKDLDGGSFVSGAIEVQMVVCDLPEVLSLDGTVYVRVDLTADFESGETSDGSGNNSTTGESTINIGKKLFAGVPERVAEISNGQVRFYLFRSGNTAQDEVVNISVSDPRLSIESPVIIPKNSSGVYVYMDILDNQILDADSIATIRFEADNYEVLEKKVIIEDDELPSLNVYSEQESVVEAETFRMIISVDRPATVDRTLSIICSAASRFSYPSTVELFAGNSSTEIEVQVLDNKVVDADFDAEFEVLSMFYNSGKMQIRVIDNDIPELGLELSPLNVSESAGLNAISGILSRASDFDRELRVLLSDDSEGRLIYSSNEIVLASGVQSVRFTIGVVDNGEVEGDQIVNVKAAVYLPSCQCTTTKSQGIATQQVRLIDDDGLALRLRTSASMLLEGEEEGVRLIVTRNTQSYEALTVTLTADNESGLLFDRTVVIPAGETSASVVVRAEANEVAGDGRTIAFEAQAEGFASGTCWLILTDQTLPDAQICGIETDKQEAIAGQEEVLLSVTVCNRGVAMLPENTPIHVYWTNEQRLVTLYTSRALKPQESLVVSRIINLPKRPGDYGLFAVINEEKRVEELLYTNNTSGTLALRALAPFSAILQADKSSYVPGETIHISGRLVGENVGGLRYELYLLNYGQRTMILSEANEDGTFDVNYTPIEGQCGVFGIGVCAPGAYDETILAEVTVLGVQQVGYTQCYPIVGVAYEGTISLKNLTSIALNGVTARLAGEALCHVESLNFGTVNLEGNGTALLPFTLVVNAASEGTDWERLPIVITSDEGLQVSETILFFARNARAKLVVDVDGNVLNTTVARGTTRDISIVIRNEGAGETGTISFSLPSFFKTVTPRELTSLKSNESTTAILRFIPTKDMMLNVPITGQIGINCTNGDGVALPFSIEMVSSSMGTLTVDVCDEYTYYTAEAPHVQGATVIVKQPVTNVEITRGVTDESGRCSFELPEGYYELDVLADSHDSKTVSVLVNPGRETLKVVNISISAITVNWKVEETEVEDEYEIITTVEYETNVPAPVVIFELPDEFHPDEMRDNEQRIVIGKVINKGLIRAEDVTLNLPNDDELQFEALAYNKPFPLAAKDSVLIPIRVTKVPDDGGTTTIGDEGETEDPENPSGSTGGSENISVRHHGSCTIDFCVEWKVICGSDGNWHYICISKQKRPCPQVVPYVPGGNGPSGPGGFGGGGGGQVGGGGGGSYTLISDDCHKCTADFKNKFMDCALDLLGWLPGFGTLLNGVQCFKGGYNALGNPLNADLVACGLKLVPGLGNIVAAYETVRDCVGPLYENPCASGNANAARRAFGIGTYTEGKDYSDYPSYIRAYLNNTEAGWKAVEAAYGIALELSGDEVFMSVSPEQLTALISYMETWNGVDEAIWELKPSGISDEQFERFVMRWRNTLLDLDEENRVNWETVREYLNVIIASEEFAEGLGYANIADLLQTEQKNVIEEMQESSSSVCASVTLQFTQRMVMARQAFRGTLTVGNGHPSKAMENVRLLLKVVNMETGAVATKHEFQINMETLIGFEGELSLDAGWSLVAGGTGVATVIFIPTKYAALKEGVDYSFGGELSYIDPFTGLEVTRKLIPQVLTVKPSPNLQLTYFMQRDILGDDALTEDVIEPMQESEFALMINNIGNGEAKNVRIQTEQPKIVENEKGLLIDFALVRSVHNGEEAAFALDGSVLNDFGNIAPQTTDYVQWFITSTLLGHFTKYDVKATHLTSYGNPDLSLIDTVTIHEMIRSIDLPTKGIGWLVNDIEDAHDLPDALYYNDGRIFDVSNAASATMEYVTPEHYQLSINGKAGWIYGNIEDATDGRQKLVQVMNARTGQTLSTRNFWQTDVTLRDGKRPLYEHKLHFIDSTASGSEIYDLFFTEVPVTPLKIDRIDGVPQEVSDTLVRDIVVHFNKPIYALSFDIDDLRLTCDGKQLDLSQVTINALSERDFHIDLSSVTTENGYYVFDIDIAHIADYDGFTGGSSAENTVFWSQYVAGDVKVTIHIVPEAGGTVAPRLTSAPYNSSFILTAVPAIGYDFVCWRSGNTILSTEASYSELALQDIDLTALFQLKQFNVAISSANEKMGTVSGAINGPCDYGKVLHLVAEPNTDYAFHHWSDGVRDAVRDIVVESDTALQAIFVQAVVHVRVAETEHGTITGAGDYPWGASVTLTAKPDFNYSLASWDDGSTELKRVIFADQDTLISATFEETRYQISVLTTDSARGLTAGSGKYTFRTIVTIEALPNEGYNFYMWDDGNKNAVRQIVVKREEEMYFALFEPNWYAVTVRSQNLEMGTVKGSGEYAFKSDVQISAIPKDGYQFVQWSDGSKDAVRTITVESKDVEFTAEFAPRNYQLTVASLDETQGSVSGSGEYPFKSVVTISAEAFEGYEFAAWNDGNLNATREITITNQDVTYYATFVPRRFMVVAASEDETMGTVLGGGEYAYLSEVTLRAIANYGHHFVRWSDGNKDPERTIVVEAKDTMLTAYFFSDKVKVELAVNDTLMGTVTGAGEYIAGDLVVIEAIPFENYVFHSWSDGNDEPLREFIIEEDINIIAIFTEIGGTALSNIEADGWRAQCENMTLLLSGTNGKDYSVYSLSGSLIYHGAETQITLPQAGLYMVRFADTTQKVIAVEP